jgi:hypothetical protein
MWFFKSVCKILPQDKFIPVSLKKIDNIGHYNAKTKPFINVPKGDKFVKDINPNLLVTAVLCVHETCQSPNLQSWSCHTKQTLLTNVKL